MKLTLSIDFEILEAMQNGVRQTSQRLANEHLDYRQRYINQEMRKLAGHGLLQQVGETPMYVITDAGKRALKYRDLYRHDEAAMWGELVRGDLDIEDANVESLLPDETSLSDVSRGDFDSISDH